MAWRSCLRFLREVGTVIVVSSVALSWLLLKIPSPIAPTEPPPAGATASMIAEQRSVAATVGHFLEPVTRPLGFDLADQRGPHRQLRGAGAHSLHPRRHLWRGEPKRGDDDVKPLAERLAANPAYGPATALALMAFFVLACQCMSTVAALRRETHSWRVPAFVLAYTYTAAYVAALIVHQVARVWLALGAAAEGPPSPAGSGRPGCRRAGARRCLAAAWARPGGRCEWTGSRRRRNGRSDPRASRDSGGPGRRHRCPCGGR